MDPRYAILMDGGFVTKKISQKEKRPATENDIVSLVTRIGQHETLSNLDLLRVYYYDAKPASKVLTNPIDNSTIRLGETAVYHRNVRLLQKLEMLPDFALRLGETVVHGWELGAVAAADITARPRAPEARDFVPNIEQKGVDLRIGLDIARLSLSGIVRTIVVVTGDSDMIPAFTFARREGVRVYLDHMGHGVKRDLKVHTDRIL